MDHLLTVPRTVIKTGMCCAISCKQLFNTGKELFYETKKNPMQLLVRIICALIFPMFAAGVFIAHRYLRKEIDQTVEALRQFQLDDMRFFLAFLIAMLVSPIFALALPSFSLISTVLSFGALVYAGYKIGSIQLSIYRMENPPTPGPLEITGQETAQEEG